MIKFLTLIFSVLFLSSCFNTVSQDKNTTTTSVQNSENKVIENQTGSTKTGEVLPVNEKTSKVEQEFSNDLNNLLNLVDEDSSEK